MSDEIMTREEFEKLGTPQQLIVNAMVEALGGNDSETDKKFQVIAERTAFHIRGYYRALVESSK